MSLIIECHSRWNVTDVPYFLHNVSQLSYIPYFVGFLIYSGACGRDEGYGGREDRNKKEQETNQPDMFVSMASINIQMATMDSIVSF